jgi:hypothetical protein
LRVFHSFLKCFLMSANLIHRSRVCAANWAPRVRPLSRETVVRPLDHWNLLFEPRPERVISSQGLPGAVALERGMGFQSCRSCGQDWNPAHDEFVRAGAQHPVSQRRFPKVPQDSQDSEDSRRFPKVPEGSEDSRRRPKISKIPPARTEVESSESSLGNPSFRGIFGRNEAITRVLRPPEF